LCPALFLETPSPKDLPASPVLGDVIRTVWSNAVVTSQCPDLVIRLTTLRGSVSQHVWQSLGHDPQEIQLLAVGSTDHPLHLPKYGGFLRNFYARTARLTDAYPQQPEFDTGYDLLAAGSSVVRRAMLSLFNEHYGAPQNVLEAFCESSSLTCGGMRGLKDLADAQVLAASKQGTFVRFIQPDNSFGTWWNIIESPATRHLDRRQIVTLATKPENRLHLSVEDVEQYYREHAAHSHECWYITPVGNPSGTKMGNYVGELVARIVAHSPTAVIILDSVYVRTLRREAAAALLKDLWSRPEALDRVVFLESLSKSHGLCRERLGMYCSTNAKLFTSLHTANMGFSAGPGQMKDLQFAAVAASTAADKQGVDDLHVFWRDERKALVRFLLQPKFGDLFEPQQPHVHSEDLDNPCTLYVLLRTREGIKSSAVFERTGALGVDTPLRSGHYIRFALGMMKQPFFSKK
jgi:hypothetical protein